MTDVNMTGPLARPEEGLRRALKQRHLQLIALGGIIGSGYFLGTGQILSTVGPAAVLSYMLGGIIVICVMLCLGELAVACPVSSSFVTYARQLISPTWACGVGWSYWLTWVAYVPAEMIAAGIIMESLVPGMDKLVVVSLWSDDHGYQSVLCKGFRRG
jgi:AAT family amino acid transporter